MVVETEYYDLLGIKPDASDLEIKKAYRKLAITTHPDKNPNDATAQARFQAIGEAYQILSNKDLRAAYDRYGKDKAKPNEGFEDPAEFFSMIFGGDAFVDLIGEISLMKDLTHTMDIAQEQAEEEELATRAQEKLNVQDGKERKPSNTPVFGKAGPEASTAHTTPPPYVSGLAEEASNPRTHPPYVSTMAEEASTNHSTHPPYVSGMAGEASTSGLNIPSTSERTSGTSTPSRRVYGQQAIMDKSEEEARMDAAGLSQEEKDLQKKKKKGGLTKEQRERLEAYEAERRKAREDRVNTLAKKLVDRISIWTETEKGPEVTVAFQEKTRLEVENLKMESFGLEILHAVGTTYLQKATSFLKSQKFLGISGFFSRLKDKGTLAKETWNTISTAIDAQLTMEEMAKLEEKGGEDWTDEKKAEYERKVTGKILAAAWRGSKFEIQSVLREVCDRILNDKTVRMEKRVERAHALVLCGTIYQKAERDPEEEGDFMAFEQLMAESMKKQEKKKEKEKDKKHSHSYATDSKASGTPEKPNATV